MQELYGVVGGAVEEDGEPKVGGSCLVRQEEKGGGGDSRGAGIYRIIICIIQSGCVCFLLAEMGLSNG
ncbi:hypothetical protein GWI33_023384 [Rhynchophorus ferrugineus]|uniref:Uncharacterized protein n=1 Tax=Rhynchophorus ferrugineus TaxID=354439 RepID=A0A834HLG0_RHYFE|nr:hypothetical protein GWI33_023384 [Rhynchophorus ferrugineus]